MNPPPAQPTPPAHETCAMPTPRTDALERATRDYYEAHREAGEPPFDSDAHDFARTLERENASLVARCARLEKALEELRSELLDHEDGTPDCSPAARLANRCLVILNPVL